MRAMILAAGRGERMMPLTANKPKPMLLVNGKPLLEYHVENLAAAGITEIVINYAWCGQAIIDYFGNGERWGVNIQYSDESTGALETAGGIIKALPLLLKNTEMLLASTDNKSTNDNCFWVINGDVFCSFNFNQLPILSAEQTACIWLVENPEHNLFGDFCLENGWVKNKKQALSKTPNETLTFTGIALYQASFFL